MGILSWTVLGLIAGFIGSKIVIRQGQGFWLDIGLGIGIVGCGNIGAIVASRALGLEMKVVAYDPFLSPERARAIGVEKLELDDLFARADFITLHTPLTDATRNIVDRAAIARMKRGVRIINCARGGLVVEEDLAAALDETADRAARTARAIIADPGR